MLWLVLCLALATPGGSPRYTGEKIDIDVKDAPLDDVFRLLAEVGDVNIVIADDVTGTITLRLRQVPWDQVLHTVARVKHLEIRREQGIYLVSRRQ